MCVEAAKITEKYLAIDSNRLLNADDLGDGLQLLANQRLRKGTGEFDGFECVCEGCREAYAALEGGVCRLHYLETVAEVHHILHRGQSRRSAGSSKQGRPADGNCR